MESVSTDQTLQQLMFSLIEIWQTCGKSQQEFCREKESDYNKFQYWLRKYKRSNAKTEISVRPSFKRIKIQDYSSANSVTAGLLELIFPDGRKLIFHQPVEASFVRSLLG